MARVARSETLLITNLPVVTPSGTYLEVRPLPSPGITRLQRYYEPVRLPPWPGLTLTSLRFDRPKRDHHDGSLVLRDRSPYRVPSSLPRWNRRSPAVLGFADNGLPHCDGGSASTTKVFGACSTFTRVMARRLAELLNSPLTPRALDRLLSPDRPRLLPGVQPPPGMGLAPTGTITPSRRRQLQLVTDHQLSHLRCNDSGKRTSTPLRDGSVTRLSQPIGQRDTCLPRC